MNVADVLTPVERAGLLAHSRTPRFKRMISETLEFLGSALSVHRAHVSVSGGKDSTLAWYLCSKALARSLPGADIPGVHMDSGGEHPASAAFLAEEVSASVGGPLHTYYPHLTYPELLRLAYGGSRRISSNALMRYIIDEPASRAAADLGSDSYVIGLRMEESRGRKLTGLVHGNLYSPEDGSLTRIAPLLRWSWRDVWAATVTFDLPVHPAYAERLPGESIEHMRVGVLTDLSSAHTPATLSRFALNDPSAYARLKASVPEAPWPI